MADVLLIEATPIDSLDLAHRRFDHLGMDSIKLMSQKDCYSERGFRVNSSDFRKIYCKCDVCKLAKIKKFVSHISSESYSYLPGEFYFVDFSGLFEVSMQGNVYMVLFIDRNKNQNYTVDDLAHQKGTTTRMVYNIE